MWIKDLMSWRVPNGCIWCTWRSRRSLALFRCYLKYFHGIQTYPRISAGPVDHMTSCISLLHIIWLNTPPHSEMPWTESLYLQESLGRHPTMWRMKREFYINWILLIQLYWFTSCILIIIKEKSLPELIKVIFNIYIRVQDIYTEMTEEKSKRLEVGSPPLLEHMHEPLPHVNTTHNDILERLLKICISNQYGTDNL